jgi:hypothetical protein
MAKRLPLSIVNPRLKSQSVLPLTFFPPPQQKPPCPRNGKQATQDQQPDRPVGRSACEKMRYT